MKSKLSQWLVLAAIIVFVALICLYGLQYDEKQIDETRNRTVSLNNTQKNYINENKDVSIYIDEELRYLMTGEDEGFLYEYLCEVFAPVSLEVHLTDKENADCSLMIITDEIRLANLETGYTSPIFQMDGAFFIHEESIDKKQLSGIVVKNRMSQDELEKITYGEHDLEFTQVEGTTEAVAAVREDKKDFIIGDRSTVIDAMGEETDFIIAEESIYSMNVCIMTDEENEVLYGILNECILSADMYSLSYEMGQKWMEGNAPLYMDDSYEDIYLFIMIIFASVMIVFFIYYQTNKNLYRELNDRMIQLTESKQELKTTFNGVGYYLAELDMEGNIIDINRAFYDFVNTDTANRKVWDVLDMDIGYKEGLKKLTQKAAEGELVSGIEVMLKKQTLVLDIFPIENARGTIEKLLFMGMDVTRERMAERQLLQDNKMIAVGQLAAGVAHEIRNPLGLIRNYCYVLKTMDDQNVRDKAIEQIEKAVDNSGLIINNLLDFSRIPSHDAQHVDIEDHIKSLMILNKNIIKKKNINVHIVCPEEVHTILLTQSLDMILINLISNATDAMQENGELTIAVTKNEGSFEIEVKDTGAGIDPGIIEEIFNPFFTTKGGSGGTGLGLYIVYNEVKKMNGEITVESTVGEGTCFSLTLPLMEADENDKENE